MPMCDAHIPEGALPPTAERELLSKVTDLLLLHEGVDPSNQAARALAWVFVHRHEMYVAGARPRRRTTSSSARYPRVSTMTSAARP